MLLGIGIPYTVVLSSGGTVNVSINCIIRKKQLIQAKREYKLLIYLIDD
jgi:hypothetical protein